MSASTGTTVAVLVGALVVLGLAMIGVAVWLVRSTREDPPALGPLEVMGERRWRRGDADRRRTNLDTARPPGAPPPAPILAFEPAIADASGDTNVNCDASVQESARSGHSSPVEPAEMEGEVDVEPVDPESEVGVGGEDGDGDGDDDVAGESGSEPSDTETEVGVEATADGPPSEESAVSVPGSEEDPGDAGSDADADKKE